MNDVTVILLKWGDKYTSDNVNELAKELSKYFSRIVCFTDDPTGVEIETIDIPLKPRVTRWWNKLKLFSDDFEIKGKCVLFDLDIKVNFDPNDYLEWNDSITLVSAYYKRTDLRYYIKHKYDTIFNSSVMTWETGTVGHIWNHFLTNKDYFTRKYKGIDRFVMWEPGIKVYVFKDGIMNAPKYGALNFPCAIDHGDIIGQNKVIQ